MVVDLRRNPRKLYVAELRDGDGNHVYRVIVRRRGVDGQPIRRDPEPVLDEQSRRYYSQRTMGNDVYAWDWKAIGNGKVSCNFEDDPVEHRVADGPIVLMQKVFERVVW